MSESFKGERNSVQAAVAADYSVTEAREWINEKSLHLWTVAHPAIPTYTHDQTLENNYGARSVVILHDII